MESPDLFSKRSNSFNGLNNSISNSQIINQSENASTKVGAYGGSDKPITDRMKDCASKIFVDNNALNSNLPKDEDENALRKLKMELNKYKGSNFNLDLSVKYKKTLENIIEKDVNGEKLQNMRDLGKIIKNELREKHPNVGKVVIMSEKTGAKDQLAPMREQEKQLGAVLKALLTNKDVPFAFDPAGTRLKELIPSELAQAHQNLDHGKLIIPSFDHNKKTYDLHISRSTYEANKAHFATEFSVKDGYKMGQIFVYDDALFKKEVANYCQMHQAILAKTQVGNDNNENKSLGNVNILKKKLDKKSKAADDIKKAGEKRKDFGETQYREQVLIKMYNENAHIGKTERDKETENNIKTTDKQHDALKDIQQSKDKRKDEEKIR